MILDAPFELFAWGVDDPRIGPFFDEPLAMERLANIAVQTAEGDLDYVADSIFFLLDKDAGSLQFAKKQMRDYFDRGWCRIVSDYVMSNQSIAPVDWGATTPRFQE